MSTKRSWIGVALLAGSWLVGLNYFHVADAVAWAALVVLGTLFMFGATKRRPPAGAAIVGAVLLVPAIWLLGWPWRIGPAMMAAGLVVLAVPFGRNFFRRLGWPLVAAGIVLAVQAAGLLAHADLTARAPDLPGPLAKAVAYVVGMLHAGPNDPVDMAWTLIGKRLPLAGTSRHVGATWTLLLDPMTACFIAGAVGMFVVGLFDSAAASLRAFFAGLCRLVRLAVAVAIWLPLRAGLLIAVYCHLAIYNSAGPGGQAAFTDVLLNPWLHLALLAGPVLLAWRVRSMKQTSAEEEPAETAGGEPAEPARDERVELYGDIAPGGTEPKIGALAVFAMILAAATAVAATAAVVWDPPGQAKPGRVLFDEYHSQQPYAGKTYDPTATDQPFNTQSFGPVAENNWACIYDYVSHFRECGRIKNPLTEAALDAADVLVIKVPSKALTADEIEAVCRFVRRGGGLLMVGGPLNEYGSADVLNQLARKLGCRIRTDAAMAIDEPAPRRCSGAATREADANADELTCPAEICWDDITAKLRWGLGRKFGRWQPVAPHPIMQYVGPVNLDAPLPDASGAGVVQGATIAFRTGRAVVLRPGLRAVRPMLFDAADKSGLLASLEAGNSDTTEVRHGAFAQLWAKRVGRGRVVAFADASIFSNASAFQPHRRQLMLGMIEWLNRENTLPDPRWIIALAAVGLGLLALAATRPMVKAWPLALGAAALGWAGAVMATNVMNHRTLPPPMPARPMVQVAIATDISNVQLPGCRGHSLTGTLQTGHAPRLGSGQAGAPRTAHAGTEQTDAADSFGTFERSILRLGYFPCRARPRRPSHIPWPVKARPAGDCVGDPNVLVVIKPAEGITDERVEAIEKYVEAGGTLVVMESSYRNKILSNDKLLEPFGLKFVPATSSIGIRGTTVAADGLPAISIQAAWSVAGGTPLVRIQPPVGGDSAAMPVADVVAAVASKGKGRVVAIGFADSLSDAAMGASPGAKPTADQRKAMKFTFALLRRIVEGKLPTSAPRTQPANAPDGEASKGMAMRSGLM